MKQILHIFIKDTRRFWLEILISLAILAALVYLSSYLYSLPIPAHWLRPTNAAGRREIEMRELFALFTLLIPVSWWILIARVIHAESLVGDRQFWLTRPYGWQKLIAAKLLFLAVFLYLSLVVAQCLMLVAAGLNPLASIAGMLFNLLLFTGIFVLPLIAIATVTSNFFRMTLTLLCVLIGMEVIAGPSRTNLQNFFNGDLWGGGLIYTIRLSFSLAHLLPSGSQLDLALLLLAICGAAIVLQYAQRRAWLSRLLLLAAPVILSVIVFAVPHKALSDQTEMNRDFPPPSAGTAAVQLSDGRDEHHPLIAHQDSPLDDFIWIKIPLHLSPIQEGTAIVSDDLEVTVTNASGFSWSTKVLDLYPKQFLPAGSNRSGYWPEQQRGASFQMPLSVYDHFKSAAFTVRFTLAFTELQATQVTRIPFPTHRVLVPGLGICGPSVADMAYLQCRSAFREPPYTYASADWSYAPCSASETELKEMRSDTWMGLVYSEPAEFGIVPIMFSQVAFMSDHNNPTGGKHLCTDTPITLTQYKPVRRTQTSLTIPDMHFPA